MAVNHTTQSLLRLTIFNHIFSDRKQRSCYSNATHLFVNTYLDTERLAGLIRRKRATKGLREISAEISISAATLSRVENGSMPDMETFIVLCDWLQVPPGDLFVTDHQPQERLDIEEEVMILLLGDKRLESETAYALAQIVKATYRYLLE
ncbi:helix-turn-helix domain-containing protein [Nostoc sp. 'Peltigera membranacea cyanobiont' 210A]|uniref:helix-turn-helix domain-containing protein n=1 Tax=Nostoc sp. 'Peltigera membranacea cyanobiont' 210A TaxID=2014529 RepID=UPI001CB8D490|nr:helix-turn-helix transcriptional regulator [Nostoc sp. 'Peltigera membranacea cyanobiont' 210A]